jgi:hypothetical protein
MLPNIVTSAVTGKYNINQTQEKSPWGTYLIKWIVALAADTQSAAEEKTLGLSGLAFSP